MKQNFILFLKKSNRWLLIIYIISLMNKVNMNVVNSINGPSLWSPRSREFAHDIFHKNNDIIFRTVPTFHICAAIVFTSKFEKSSRHHSVPRLGVKRCLHAFYTRRPLSSRYICPQASSTVSKYLLGRSYSRFMPEFNCRWKLKKFMLRALLTSANGRSIYNFFTIAPGVRISLLE